ncbi:porin [Paraburkholderia sp. ZP32-5]|uniref:porin n=1 Tax=Paraburkholderia sp. ZP32-5 TaxID=2883245 RepID=UPI001F218CD1|nr:porin [Paraburkholderia sp. ZP32-5]
MKRRFTLAALSMSCAIAPCAYAQSSVTLYGITDVGIEVANHVPGPNGTSGTAVRMQSGSLAGSRWGLRGVEDLGGGIKAIFDLENGFSLNNGTLGQGGRMFGRKAYVGVSTRYGELTLGRQYNLLYELMFVYDPLQFNPSYSAQGYDATLVGRADNSVRYLARFSGVTFGALYSSGFDSTIANGAQVPGHSKVGREYSFSLQYATGPANVGVAYDQMQGTSIATQDYTQMRVVGGATYAFGPVKAYVGTRWLNIRNTSTLQSSLLYWLGTSWQVNAPLTISLGGYQERIRGTGQKATSGVLLADYFLSKRTDIYAEASYISNSKGLNIGVRAIGDVTTGSNQTGAMIGIKHSF